MTIPDSREHCTSYHKVETLLYILTYLTLGTWGGTFTVGLCSFHSPVLAGRVATFRESICRWRPYTRGQGDRGRYKPSSPHPRPDPAKLQNKRKLVDHHLIQEMWIKHAYILGTWRLVGYRTVRLTVLYWPQKIITSCPQATPSFSTLHEIRDKREGLKHLLSEVTWHIKSGRRVNMEC